MPLTDINLNKSPYFNDFDSNQQYYQYLFKPSLPVQVREMNGMQFMQQNQVEVFADNIFKKGTIMDGCNFTFHTSYQYVKLPDSDVDGLSIVPSNYVGLFVKNASGLTAQIVDAVDGFEASAPDLNTIYVNYTNSGNSTTSNAFSSGETITVYDSNTSIPSIVVTAGGSGFSNTDALVVVPQIVVICDTGAFTNGDNLVQPSTGANVEVITATQVANSTTYVLKVKPKNADLANGSVNALAWTIDLYEPVTTPANTVAATVERIVGSGFQGSIETNGVGKITSIDIFDSGREYTELPFVTVKSANNLSGINSIDLTPRNYHAQIKIPVAAESIGNGYAFSVSEGRIYQKGYFTKVDEQTVIVEKYTNSPNNVVVGFNTREEIVTADIDTSLYDNALGTENETAPGADRLKLIPELVVLSKTDATSNSLFTSLVEWSGGQPYKQNKATQYSRLGDDMAQRTFDESGNFVVDTFQIATASIANTELEGSKATVVVDPGQAYIQGYKVQTLRNYYIDIDKGIDTQTVNNFISLNYGNYVRVKEVGGLFQFSTADSIDLYSSAKGFLSNASLIASGNTTPVGSKIGTARMRSLTLESGVAGDPNAVYKLYLFDVKMNTGQNFEEVRSVYYNGSSNKGIADVVLNINPTSGANIAELSSTKQNRLIFGAGVESLKNSNNTNYIYRTIDQTTTFANTGVLTKSIAANPDEFYPYSGNLSFAQMTELYVVPVGNNLTQYTDLTGTVSVNTTSNVVTGSGTNFYSDFEAGDYVKCIANSTTSEMRKVTAVVNATSMRVASEFTFANGSCTFKRVFPKNVPIPFGTRTGLTANVDINMNILTLKLAHSNGLALTVEGTATVNTALGVNIKRTSTTSTSKTANRNQFVKIYCGNNAGGSNGPWCLGVPDIFRLRNVYVGNSTVNTSSSKVTNFFYIDHNQNANYLDYGWLMKSPKKRLALSNTDYLLVEFDYFTRSSPGGYFDTVSYLGTSNSAQIFELNSKPLANLTSSASSFEVPEVYTYNNEYYDLLNNLDFRPAATATVSPSGNAALAPLNPNSVVSFGNTADPANDKKFPLPDATATTTIEHYLGRVDSVFISGETGEIYTIKGIPDVDPRRRYEANHPKSSLKLHVISVPAYPNITDANSPEVNELVGTRIANERTTNIRLKSKAISPILSSYEFQLAQPMVYTMEDIANLERRIKDLEYYQGLSVMETSITNKIIPSSIDASLNRFKFGFFADDFSTEVYSDIDNPQFAATIEVEGDYSYGASKSPLETETNWANSDKTSPTSTILSPSKIVKKATNRAVPAKFNWTLPHGITNLPYIDQAIISQDIATENTDPVKPTDPPIDQCVKKIVNVGTASSNGYIHVSYKKKNSSVVNVTLAAKSGPVTLYFNNIDTQLDIDVYKGDTLVASSSAAAASVVNLTTANKTFLNSTAKDTGYIATGSFKPFSRIGDAVRGSGKITFTHNHTTGLTYTIVATKVKGSFWQYLLEYPLTRAPRAQTIIEPCVITNINNVTVKPPAPLQYIGTIKIPPKESSIAWSCSKLFAINNVRIQGMFLEATGLKPNTRHKFFVDGKDYSENCALIPQRKYLEAVAASDNNTDAWSNDPGIRAWFNLYQQYFDEAGDNLVSDSEGKLSILFTAPVSEYSWFSAISNSARRKTWGSSGYSTFMMKGNNSIATKLVARRKSDSPLPLTPNGNP